MKKTKIAVTAMDEAISELAASTDHIILGTWAADCADRVLHYFEDRHPQDDRPRKAIETLRAWIRTGEFSMAVIRKASLSAHAAAREVEGEDSARSAARAAGQAVATAHAPRHAIAAALYAATAVRDSTDPEGAGAAAAGERNWQYRHLLELTHG